MAFGKRGYLFAAANLAMSIKHHTPSAPLVLHVQEDLLRHVKPQYLAAFDCVEALTKEAYARGGIIDPGWAKVNIVERMGRGGLYLDADMLCVRDIGPWLTQLSEDARPFVTHVVDRGTGDVDYTPWVRPATQRRVLGVDMVWGLNTSWMLLRPHPLHDAVRDHFTRWTLADLAHQWGGTMPDELAFASACSTEHHDPTWHSEEVFFGNKNTLASMAEIQERYSLVALYGKLAGQTVVRPRYLNMYDHAMRKACATFGLPHIYTLRHIAPDKHVQLRTPTPA